MLGVDILIYVTLGTQDKSFKRLLEAIQKQIDLGNIKEEVIVQAGCTKFESKDMKIFDLVSRDKFDKYMDECDLLITHGGVGSIIGGLTHGKKVIAAARLEKFKEHTNDHQIQIIDVFSKEGYILALENFDELDAVLEKAKKFKPRKFVSNTDKFANKLKDYIDNN